MATPGAAALPSENESVDSDTEDPLALELRGCSVMPDLNGVYKLIEDSDDRKLYAEILGHERPIYRMDDADHEIYCYFRQEILKNGRTSW